MENAINNLATMQAIPGAAVHVTAGVSSNGTPYYQVAFDTGPVAGVQEPLLVAAQPLGSPPVVVAEVVQGGSSSNTYTGLTTVADGTLQLNKAGLGATVSVTPNLGGSPAKVISQAVTVSGANGQGFTLTVNGQTTRTLPVGARRPRSSRPWKRCRASGSRPTMSPTSP